MFDRKSDYTDKPVAVTVAVKANQRANTLLKQLKVFLLLSPLAAASEPKGKKAIKPIGLCGTVSFGFVLAHCSFCR